MRCRDPLLEVSEIKAALGRIQGQAWYLFQGVDLRVFFGQTANVTAEITEIASNIAEEQVDQTLRGKLQEVFKPRAGALYSERMAILPGLDEIQLDDERPTLVILERAADQLPQDFEDWWKKQDLQNRVLVLTADPNAVSTLRISARRMRAIDKVEERIKAQHGSSSSQMQELQGVKEREAAGFTSALRETFKTIMFPTGKSLRRVDDFRMEFDRNDYSGEQQIVDTLTKRGKYISSDKFDVEFETLRLDAEEILFDADAVQQSSLRRNPDKDQKPVDDFFASKLADRIRIDDWRKQLTLVRGVMLDIAEQGSQQGLVDLKRETVKVVRAIERLEAFLGLKAPH